MGYRYRLHDRRLPGCPDLVFPRFRKVLYVNGCFWHQHPDPACKLARLPKSRLDFWQAKLEGNRRRDEDNQKAVLKLGWRFMVIWECELRGAADLENKIKSFLEGDE
jgi:DNA mismatch endonuclease (patch repair protein)